MSFLALLSVTFVIVLSAVTLMAIGVLCGRQAIRGSCGGIAGRCASCSGASHCKKRARGAKPGD